MLSIVSMISIIWRLIATTFSSFSSFTLCSTSATVGQLLCTSFSTFSTSTRSLRISAISFAICSCCCSFCFSRCLRNSCSNRFWAAHDSASSSVLRCVNISSITFTSDSESFFDSVARKCLKVSPSPLPIASPRPGCPPFGETMPAWDLFR
uniref:Putative secreted protein n=1 Tax=Anopheles marajoara TaxID=58244 RepID=A0A2M4C6C6_9DIPT